MIPGLLLWLLAAVNIAFAQSSATTSAVPAVNSTRPLGTRAHHGLSSTGMQVNSIYVGVLPDWAKESPIDVNKALGKSIAIIGDYIYVTLNSRNPFSQMDYHSDPVIRLKNFSVYAPAIIPNFALGSWTTQMSTDLAAECATFNKQGVTVWLRFAYEMNGGWMQYGLDPDTYKTKWRELATAVQQNADANSTYMLWSPNIAGGDVDGIQGYTQYWPGDDVVDIVGLSFYFSGKDKSQNTMPQDDEFANSFAPFYRLYGSKWPVVISETSAQRHYEIPSGFDQQGWDTEVNQVPALSSLVPVPSSGSPDELSIKSNWLQQMTGSDSARRFPNLTSISIFNYFKEGNSSQFNDFRYIGGNETVETWLRSYVGNTTAYQGGFDGSGSRTMPSAWTILVIAVVSLIVKYVS